MNAVFKPLKMSKAFIINLKKEVSDAKKANHFLEAIGRIQIHISYYARQLLTKKYPEFEEFFKSKDAKDYLVFKLLWLAGIISKSEYQKLDKFRIKRNELIHKLTAINQYNSQEINKLIKFGLELFNKLNNKL